MDQEERCNSGLETSVPGSTEMPICQLRLANVLERSSGRHLEGTGGFELRTLESSLWICGRRGSSSPTNFLELFQAGCQDTDYSSFEESALSIIDSHSIRSHVQIDEDCGRSATACVDSLRIFTVQFMRLSMHLCPVPPIDRLEAVGGVISRAESIMNQ